MVTSTTPNKTDNMPKHLACLDGLRGLAAVSILVWHYQHFYFTKPKSVLSIETRVGQPLYDYLWPFYEHGYFAVQIFWMLSGIVFAHVYFQGGKIDTRRFVWHRFTRLYPLHFFTLLLVAGLQFISVKTTGAWQIYAHNDPFHFALNLFMASNWGLESGFSFNGPFWSVSVEVIAYATFIFLCPFLSRRPLTTTLLGWSSLLISQFMVDGIILECIGYFYIGGSVWHCMIGGWSRRLFRTRIFLAAVTLGLVLSLTLLKGTEAQVLLALSCTTIAVWFDTNTHYRPAVLQKLGDYSYAIYLLHVPFQISILILFQRGVLDRGLAQDPLFLLFFLVAVVGLSAVVHAFVDLPIRRWLRQFGSKAA